jgi:hypothetical protein
VLASCTQIPANTKLHLSRCLQHAVVHLAIKDCGPGWLPAVLTTLPEQGVVAAVDDCDISAVALVAPSQ